MRLFSNTRARRSAAFVVLLVWLFAVASGIANACLLEAPGTHSRVAETGLAETVHAPAELAGHAGAAYSHDDDSGNAKESCLKVCDDGSKTPVKLQSGLDLADPGTAPLLAITWGAATPFVSGSCHLAEMQALFVGPPVRVRYSRLAL
jgi:hypothetical protein